MIQNEPKQLHQMIICQCMSFLTLLRGSSAPKRQRIYLSLKNSWWSCNSSPISVFPRSPVSPEFMEVRGLDGRFITLVSSQTQTDWEWVEQSLSFSCQGKPCHQFGGEVGHLFLPPSCLSWHLWNSQLFLSCAVQKEIEDLQLSQAAVESVDTDSSQVICSCV